MISALPKNRIWRALIFSVLLLAQTLTSTCFANEMPLDGISASGLVAKDEKNIQIEKEVLYISRSKIEVNYIFKNSSDQDIVTDVAFPIPHHIYRPPQNVKYPVHNDFKVEIDGKRIVHKELTRALHNGRDYAALLSSMNITASDFGNEGAFIEHLNNADKQKLLNLGLIGSGDFDKLEPAWSLERSYYWPQTFPRNRSITVKITYTPNASTTEYPFAHKTFINRNKSVSEPSKASISDLLCLKEEITKFTKNQIFPVQIVDYILTSANHWRMPIKDFKLIIESTPDYTKELVSTCFMKDKVQRISSKRLEISIKDYVPSEEVTAIFILY